MKNILELLKKNLATVACALVAVIAIVANYIPMGGLRDELHQAAQTRAGEYDTVDKLLTASRTLPNLDPANSEAKPLEGFPTEAVIKRGEEVVKTFTDRSQAVYDWVNGINQKEPLEPGALPSPGVVQTDRFQRAYTRAVDVSPAGRATSLPVTLMQAGFAPTADDFAAAVDATTRTVNASVAQVQNGSIVNPEAVKAELDAQLSTLQDRIVRESANKTMVYISPDTMDVTPGIVNANTAPPPTTLFWAQMTLWAQEELFKAIAKVNTLAGGKNVSESPIKHLLKVVVPPQFVGVGAAQPGADPSAAPPPPPNDPNAPLTPNFRLSPSGRSSNGLYDVLHAEVAMVVEAEKLPSVLTQLSTGRLLSVIHVKQVEPVDVAAASRAGYFYGDKPCVRVQMTVEALMLRRWTVAYMPKPVKDALGIVEAPAAPPPG